MPERIQQRRTKGWRKPENTVSVARPSRFGNPFSIGWWFTVVDTVGVIVDRSKTRRVYVRDAGTAVALYREWMEHRIDLLTFHRRPTRAELRALAGKNLMCFCPRQPCHADVLLELANAPVGEGEQ